jgi:hypothetical protein
VISLTAKSTSKEIYEALHPETKHGGDRKSDQVASGATRSDRFTAATAKATGKAERTIRQAARHGRPRVVARTELAGDAVNWSRQDRMRPHTASGTFICYGFIVSRSVRLDEKRR